MKTVDLVPIILDLDVTCPLCAYRIAPAEVEGLTPETVHCPGCRQDFPKEQKRFA